MSIAAKQTMVQQIKADNADINDANSNKPGYFRSSINKIADKRVSQVLMNKMHNEFSDGFQELGVLKACLFYRSRVAIPGAP